MENQSVKDQLDLYFRESIFVVFFRARIVIVIYTSAVEVSKSIISYCVEQKN